MWLWLWNWKISVVSASNIGLLVALSIWWTGLPIESIGRSNLFNSMPEFCTHVIQFNSKSLFMMMIFCYNKPVVHNVSSERIFQWQWFLWLLNYHQNYGSQHHNYDDHHYNYDGLHYIMTIINIITTVFIIIMTIIIIITAVFIIIMTTILSPGVCVGALNLPVHPHPLPDYLFFVQIPTVHQVIDPFIFSPLLPSFR